jgi:DNA replication protein DnaC
MQGKRVRFFSGTALVTQLLEAREDRQLERFLKRLEKQHLIILDEFGYVPFSKAGAELLFEVVSRAYERTSLILTTNLPFKPRAVQSRELGAREPWSSLANNAA